MHISASAITLTVDDVPASSQFLITHLGFREEMSAPGFASLQRDDVGMNIVFMALGSEVLPPDLREQRASGAVVAFVVTNLDVEEARLRREGVHISLPIQTQPWGERLFMVTDSNGVVYELVEWVTPASQAPPPSVGHGFIEVRGARENNLRGVSLDIPKRKLTVFTGVSGSGKSSLVFGTIAAESQRLINETFTTFVQSILPRYGRPDVDELRNLSAAILVGQERMGGNSRSTVGTATDAYALLRVLYARLGQPYVGQGSAFSFNDPSGMCPMCEGLGRMSTVDLDRLVDRDKSLDDGALLFPTFSVGSWYWQIFAKSKFFDTTKKLRDYTEEEWHKLLHLPEAKVNVGTLNSTYEGLIPKFKRLYLSKSPDDMAPHMRAAVERVVTFARCSTCDGARLTQAALSCRIAGHNIADSAAMQVSDLAAFVRTLREPTLAPVLATLGACLDNLVHIGLGYLSLDRECATLSGGESQRVKMVRHLGSSLTDITYIFDEPSVGLHPHDVGRVNEILLRLRDKGNTVLVVEHKRDVIAIADHVVDMGPGAGGDGGAIVYEGDLAGLLTADTLTGRHLGRFQPLKTQGRTRTGSLSVTHARLHNLQDVSVELPTGVLTVVTGVAGSGKSALLRGCLPLQHPDVVLVDQRVTRGNRRSNPATYSGILDPIRKAFAKANNVDAALFSANSRGACPACKGLGLVYTDLAFLDTMVSVCETCQGRRFTDEVLTLHLRGRSIHDVLTMSVAAARAFFPEKAIRTTLDALDEVGLGYVSLGQPLDTLSGGERQRIELGIDLARAAQGTQVYVLDEPTTGLHMHDVATLIRLLDRLVDSGRTVIVIEHNLDVIARADWVVDLGPGAGREGGRVIFEGPPSALVEQDTPTGRHLRARLGG
jgi:excinuclease UvrABC ATPase subunit